MTPKQAWHWFAEHNGEMRVKFKYGYIYIDAIIDGHRESIGGLDFEVRHNLIENYQLDLIYEHRKRVLTNKNT